MSFFGKYMEMRQKTCENKTASYYWVLYPSSFDLSHSFEFKYYKLSDPKKKKKFFFLHLLSFSFINLPPSMNSKRIFGRSSLLVFIFTVSVIILFKLAGTRFIIKATEPITYYRNNDYPVCLPATYLQHHSTDKHANAALVVLLTHQTDPSRLFETVHNIQDRFNRNFKYPYVFLSHQVLDDTVQSNILSIVPNATFGHIPPEQWSYPAWIDQEKLVRSYKSVNNSTDLESDQRMARYSSGFFFDHPLLQE